MSKYAKGPSIYVADLASYNRGKLKGKWIDISGMDADDILDAMQSVVGEDGEWAIHDYEGFGCKIDEYESVENLANLAEAIEEHGAGPVGAYVGYVGMESDLVSAISDVFQGEFDREEDFAESLVEDSLNELPEWARPYFDIEAYSNDLFMGDYWSARSNEGTVYVFASR